MCEGMLKVGEYEGLGRQGEVGEGEEDSGAAGVSEARGTGWGSYLDFVWS